MNVAHIEEQSYIYGPGCRYVIWTQGCSIRCKGCWNTDMWDFSLRLNMQAEKLFDQIIALKNKIEGITLLGGEPLDQYEETVKLLRLCKAAGLSAVLFTGYEPREIVQKGMAEVQNYADIMISGRYEEGKRTLSRQWIGSKNQEIHFLSGRYKGYKIKDAQYAEISISENGALTVSGFPDETVFDIAAGKSPKNL